MSRTSTGSLFELPLTAQTLEELFAIMLRRPTNNPSFVDEVVGRGLSVGEFVRNLRTCDELRALVTRESQDSQRESEMASALAACAARTGKPAKALMAEFASLGDNCEFGFVQRHFEAEPVSIFRFANPRAGVILAGARIGFADLCEQIDIEKDSQPRPEWIVIDRKYNSRQHTFIFEGDPREDGVVARMTAHCAYLKHRFIEDMMEGAKIWVIKAVPNLELDYARQLHSALRALGPNWLLCVTDEPGAPSVERLDKGLLMGRVAGLRPEGHPQYGQFNWLHWLEVLVRAWELTCEERAA